MDVSESFEALIDSPWKKLKLVLLYILKKRAELL